MTLSNERYVIDESKSSIPCECKTSLMAEPPKSRVQQLLHDGLKSTKNYLSEHVDARLIVEQAQRNVRDLARKAEIRFNEVTGRKEAQDVSFPS